MLFNKVAEFFNWLNSESTQAINHTCRISRVTLTSGDVVDPSVCGVVTFCYFQYYSCVHPLCLRLQSVHDLALAQKEQLNILLDFNWMYGQHRIL